MNNQKVIIKTGDHKGREGFFQLSGRGGDWGFVHFINNGSRFPRATAIQLKDTEQA